jgi:hypothetical protein
MSLTRELQLSFTGYLRDPRKTPLAPPHAAPMEERRLVIYRDLVFNNVASFIAGAFPIIKQILPEDRWQQLVRDFLIEHRAQTPYFLEISQEFLRYLEDRGQRPDDPPFLQELAHYEWIELALDVADVELPPVRNPAQPLADDQPLWVSPLAWSLAYAFPVHRIGPGFQPQQPDAVPTLLLAYRNRNYQIGFMELNLQGYRLFQQLELSPGLSLAEHVQQLRVVELRDENAITGARRLVTEWFEKDLLLEQPVAQ